MRLNYLSLSMFCMAVLGTAVIVQAGAAAAPTPRTPQRAISEQFVIDIGVGNQRGACELQIVQPLGGQPCSALSSQAAPPKCPAAGPNPKPPYRKSEIRAPEEQVGEFTEESPTRGFVRINAQVKAKQRWAVLGLEQVGGTWWTTYLRYGGETFAPAWSTYQSQAYHQLWITSKCPTSDPQWAHQGKG